MRVESEETAHPQILMKPLSCSFPFPFVLDGVYFHKRLCDPAPCSSGSPPCAPFSGRRGEPGSVAPPPTRSRRVSGLPPVGVFLLDSCPRPREARERPGLPRIPGRGAERAAAGPAGAQPRAQLAGSPERIPLDQQISFYCWFCLMAFPQFLFFLLPLSQQCLAQQRRWGKEEATGPGRPQVPLPRPPGQPGAAATRASGPFFRSHN